MSVLPKEYIGDGIYIKDNGFEVILTTENGISIQNEIVIEPSEWLAIRTYFERVYKGRSQ